MIACGIDLGTSAVKIAFVDADYKIISLRVFPAIPDNIAKINEIFNEELKQLSLCRDNFLGVAATGYGKRFFLNADLVIDEINALANGVYILADKKSKSILNIGGQDIKLLKIGDDGKIIDFKMNDKCAAGTGRFFEMISRILDVPLEEFSELASLSKSCVPVSCVCAVFAESEIVSLLYKSIAKSDIIAGFHRAVARRILDFMQDGWLGGEIYFDGGLAQNKDLIIALKETFMADIKTLANPQFTSAIGAAVNLLHKRR